MNWIGLHVSTFQPSAFQARSGIPTEASVLISTFGSVDTMEPKVKVYNQISDSETLLSLNDAAKSIGMGRNKMMEDLRVSGVLRSNNTPYQKHIDSGLFEVKVKSISMGFTTKNYAQTFVTGKGLTWLSKRYPKNGDKESTPKVKTI